METLKSWSLIAVLMKVKIKSLRVFKIIIQESNILEHKLVNRFTKRGTEELSKQQALTSQMLTLMTDITLNA